MTWHTHGKQKGVPTVKVVTPKPVMPKANVGARPVTAPKNKTAAYASKVVRAPKAPHTTLGKGVKGIK